MDRDRLLATARELIDAGNHAEAARVLAGALRAGDDPLVLAAAADLAQVELNRKALALDLCRRLAELEPAGDGGPPTGIRARQAELLHELGRTGEALALLGDRGDDEPEPRQARARILLSAGLPSLAADARGRPLGFLRRRGRRRDRERLDELLESSPPAQLPGVPPEALADRLERAAEVAALLARAEALFDDDRRAEAIELLTAAVGPEPDVRLLEELARLLYYGEREEEALRVVRQARAAEPAYLSLIELELQILLYLDRHYEALRLVEGLPDAVRGRPEARSAAADLYTQLGMATLALRAYGPAAGLDAWRRADRRRLWWRCGGPLWTVHRTRAGSEEFALYMWQQSAQAQARVLTGVVGAADTPALRVVADVHLLSEARIQLWWGRANVIVRVAAGNAATVAAAAWLTVVARDSVRLAPGWSLAAGGAGAAAAYLVLRRMYGFTRAEPGDRVLTRIVPAMLGIAAAGYLVTRLPMRAGGWLAFAGTLTIALAGMATARLVGAGLVRVAGALALRRYRRGNPRAVALTGLLDLLGDLAQPVLRNDMPWRRRRLQTLEEVALTLETDLPAVFATGDEPTTRHLRRRAQCAAAALRQLKYQLVAAPPGAWSRIEAALHQDVSALATGALGLLRAVDPPEPGTRVRSRRQVAAEAARMVLFAGLPLAAVLLAQPWLRFSETILNWARVVAVAWALLYVLLSVDPTVRDKLRTAFALINMGRGLDDPAEREGAEPGPRHSR